MFGLSTVRLAIYGAAALIVAAGTVYLVKTIRDDGARVEREAITIQNRESGNVGENRRLDMRECHARGMRFDFATGKCQS